MRPARRARAGASYGAALGSVPGSTPGGRTGFRAPEDPADSHVTRDGRRVAGAARRLGLRERRMDAGLIRLIVLGAVVAVVFALEVWALCVVAARSDDDLGQR